MNDQLTLGVDIGGTAVKFIVTESGADRQPGREILRSEVATDARDPQATIRDLVVRINEVIGQQPPLRIGVACAGIVDTREGFLTRAPNLQGWEGVNLKDLLGGAWPGSRVVAVNDVNAALAGEAALGAGQGYRDIVLLALGTGVGGAVMLDRRLHYGSRFGAGEFGHMILDDDGPICQCGNRGCLEAYAGAWAIIRAAGGDTTPLMLAEAALAGEQRALTIFETVGRRLGQAVGNLLNILDPDVVIIGGGVMGAAELILDPCRRVASQTALCEASRRTPIVPAALGAYAAAAGAVILADSPGGDD